MSDCCAEVKGELARLTRAIGSLDASLSSLMARLDRLEGEVKQKPSKQEVNGLIEAAKALIVGKIPGIVTPIVTQGVAPAISLASDAQIAADLAKRSAEIAFSKARDAFNTADRAINGLAKKVEKEALEQARAKLEKQIGTVSTKATEAAATATTAKGTAAAATKTAKGAAATAGAASATAGSALSKALAMAAALASLAATVAGLFGTVTSLLTLTKLIPGLQAQIDANRAAINSSFSQLINLIEKTRAMISQLQASVARIDGVAARALSTAISGLSAATAASANALAAQGTAGQALAKSNQSLKEALKAQAIATAVEAVAGLALSKATSALGKTLANGRKIQTNASELSRLKPQVQKNTKDIAGLRQRLNGLEALINALKQKAGTVINKYYQTIHKHEHKHVTETIVKPVQVINKQETIEKTEIIREAMDIQPILARIDRNHRANQQHAARLQNQVEQVRRELTYTTSLQVDLAECDTDPQLQRFSGQGLAGLAAGMNGTIQKLNVIQGEVCDRDAVATVPEWWQIRAGADRPQLVILYRELQPDGKLGRSKWTSTVPHPLPGLTAEAIQAACGSYNKGKFYAKATLVDNSKIWVNAGSQWEAHAVAQGLLNLVQPAFKLGTTIATGETDRKASTKRVKAIRADYYPTGQANMLPADQWHLD
ncbi:MAG: hypothetical protein AAGF24_08080 [Cyanobacteria bacterium P01_H01_bin.121]